MTAQFWAMIIDFNKPLQTRRGNPVRIYAQDGGGTHPVHGAELIYGVWVAMAWTGTGTYWIDGRACDVDLINVPAEKVRWVNVYPTRAGDFFATREVANEKTNNNKRTGLLKLTFHDDKLIRAELEDV